MSRNSGGCHETAFNGNNVDEDSSADPDMQLLNRRNSVGNEPCDKNNASIHVGSPNVEEPTEPTSQQTERSKITVCLKWLRRAWVSSLLWENIFIGQPSFTIIVSILLCIIHIFRVLEPANVKNFQLDCDKLRSEFDFRLFIWQFLHRDLEHLMVNVCALLVYGWTVESIIGTIPFACTFSCLCYIIPKKWYEIQLETNKCQAARTVVGISGVVSALGIIAILLTLYRILCLLSRLKLFSPDGQEKTNLYSLCSHYFLSLAFSSLMVSIFWLNDAVLTDPNVATDVHSIGRVIGFYSFLPWLPLCILKDLFRPIKNEALSKFCTLCSENLTTILD